MRGRICLIVCALFCATSISAYDFQAGAMGFDIIPYSTAVAISYIDGNYSYKRDNISIPSSVTYNGITYSVVCIRRRLFSNWSSLKSVTIPNSVRVIEYEAFYGCSNLTSVTIPNSVTSLGSGAFRYCTNLTSVDLGNSVTSIANEAFYGCSNLTSVTIPNSVTSLESGAFRYCTNLTSVDLGNSVTSIANEAFYGCSSLASVVIPNSVTSIGEYAFSDCTRLAKVTMGRSIADIGDKAFAGCQNLLRITCMTTTPPNCNSTEVFSNYSCGLFVPCESVDDYSFHMMWGKFRNIRCMADSYTITAVPNNSVWGSITGGGAYEPLADAILTATPANGCKFVQWSDGNTDNPRTVMVTEDATYTAEFEAVIPAPLFAELSPAWKDSIGTDVYKTLTEIRVEVNAETLPVGQNVATDTTDAIIAVLDGTILTFVTQASEIYLPKICTHLFSGLFCENHLTYIDTHYLNTSNVTDMDFMFAFCDRLPNINVSHFNTANVTSMRNMFYYCHSLTSLDVSSFNTQQVTNMVSMFYGCCSLTSIDLSHFDLTNVIDYVMGDTILNGAHHMLSCCLALTEIRTPHTYPLNHMTQCLPYHKDKVWKINGEGGSIDNMFSVPTNSILNLVNQENACTTQPDFAELSPAWKDSTDMLLYLRASEIRVEVNVTELPVGQNIATDSTYAIIATLDGTILTFSTQASEIYLPQDCYQLFTKYVYHHSVLLISAYPLLTNIDTRYFNTTNVTNMSEMFYECSSLTSLDLSHFDIGNVTSMYFMLSGCSSLTEIHTPTVYPDVELTGDYRPILPDHSWDNLFWRVNGIGQAYTNMLDAPAGSVLYKDGYAPFYNIAMEANKWYFVSFPFDIQVDALRMVDANGVEREFVIAGYNGTKRAAQGYGAWEYVETQYIVSLLRGKGYAIASDYSGTLQIPSTEATEDTEDFVMPLETYPSNLPNNASWNFIGNPFAVECSINNLDFTAPITVWNAETQQYETYRKGDDDYILQPFEAFFVQQHGNVHSITFTYPR